jgi:hypothetical protein
MNFKKPNKPGKQQIQKLNRKRGEK